MLFNKIWVQWHKNLTYDVKKNEGEVSIGDFSFLLISQNQSLLDI
jgi:hypothetical protein